MQDKRKGSHTTHADTDQIGPKVLYANGEKQSSRVVRAALGKLGVSVLHCDTTRDCLDFLKTEECRLIISNAKRPAVESVELLLGAQRISPSVPVVVMVNHGDIPAAARVMKAGAVDCLERPPQKAELLRALGSALDGEARCRLLRNNPLTPAENLILRLILKGQSTTEIAEELHRSRRTVEVHRSHIMHKLKVDGMVGLVRRSAQMGLLRDWS